MHDNKQSNGPNTRYNHKTVEVPRYMEDKKSAVKDRQTPINVNYNKQNENKLRAKSVEKLVNRNNNEVKEIAFKNKSAAKTRPNHYIKQNETNKILEEEKISKTANKNKSIALKQTEQENVADSYISEEQQQNKNEEKSAAKNKSTDTASNISSNSNNSKLSNSSTATSASERNVIAKAPCGPPNNYCQRRTWITTERMNELRRQTQEAVKQNKTFTIRGCFNSVRHALLARGWVEKLDVHRKHIFTGVCQVTYDELAQTLPKRKPGETRRQYVQKCERNIMSRFLEHLPIDFLWTNRKEKCDYIDQSRNPGMVINKFHRAPFTSKEGLCLQLKDFHWFYEEGTAEMYFPRCYNVWSPEELLEFVDNFKLTACIAFLHAIVDNYRQSGFDAVFSPNGKIPFSSIDFANKRCTEYLDNCQHNDIDIEDNGRVWEHEWDSFLHQQQFMVNEGGKILADTQRLIEHFIRNSSQLLERIKNHWPQYTLDGYQNLWIVKPANKCRGRGIQLMDNLKKILNLVNPSLTTKSRFVVQKYIERPLIIHQTKFDIRQWFLVTNVQPLVVWMYKESYLRFSSQEYSLSNHHESVHLTNYAIQKKYSNAKRDKRLPTENMWDCYTFQAYLRQIGKQDMWLERIYPGMRKAIIGTMLASQENMDRRPNTFELFGADFMICEDFYPWLIEINSSPDLGATTSVTARMCPQCLEDVIKVTVDRRVDPKADTGNFELIYRQVVPPTPAYMGLNLCVKGKQLISRITPNYNYYYQRRERAFSTHAFVRPKTQTTSNAHKEMPTFNATEYVEKCLIAETINSSRSNTTNGDNNSTLHQISPRTPAKTLLSITSNVRKKLSPVRRIKEAPAQPLAYVKRRRSCGPRLPETSSEVNNHLKFIVRKCVLQKSAIPLLKAGQEHVSKSESNIAELLGDIRSKLLLKQNIRTITSETKERKKYHTLPTHMRNGNTDTTLSTNKSKSLICLNSRTEAVAAGLEATHTIQAVGKSLPYVKADRKDAISAIVRRLTAPINMSRRCISNCALEDKLNNRKKGEKTQ